MIRKITAEEKGILQRASQQNTPFATERSRALWSNVILGISYKRDRVLESARIGQILAHKRSKLLRIQWSGWSHPPESRAGEGFADVQSIGVQYLVGSRELQILQCTPLNCNPWALFISPRYISHAIR